MARARVLSIALLLILTAGAFARAGQALRWQDCLAEARKNNPQLVSAQEVVHQKEAAKAITQSGSYPQVSASADASTTRTSTASTKTAATVDSFSFGASAAQLIFDGFKKSSDTAAAKEDIQAARQAYRFTSSQVRSDLRAAFVNLLKAQELIKVVREIAKMRRENLELVTLRYQSGLEHRGSLLTAEANAAAAEFDIAQAKRSAESSQRQLNRQMGRKEFAPLEVEGDFKVVDRAEEKPSFEELAKKNPSILEAQAKKNLAVFDIRSAQAEFFPELSASASASKTGADWPPKNERSVLGLSLSMPVFEGGLRQAQVFQAQSALRQAEADERSAQDSVIVSLQDAWVSLQDALESVEVRSKALAAAEERSRISEAQYSTGFITFDDWIIIENDLVSAKKAYLEAQANALLAEAGWIQAKGETLEYAQN